MRSFMSAEDGSLLTVNMQLLVHACRIYIAIKSAFKTGWIYYLSASYVERCEYYFSLVGVFVSLSVQKCKIPPVRQ